jgi:hypothetical protein
MAVDWTRVMPVLISIVILIAIALLRNYSRTFAAVAATMPANITLGLFIVYSSAEDRPTELREFSSALLLNIIPTLFFIIFAWYAARQGWSLVPILLGGYVIWAMGVGIIFLLRGP